MKIPKILKILAVEGHCIDVVFNNGEHRRLDFDKIFREMGVQDHDPVSILREPEALYQASIEGNTLSWKLVEQYITNRNGKKIQVPFEIGADVLYGFSEKIPNGFLSEIGEMIRSERVKSGLTQEELAQKSGTSRTYISRIENKKSDLELSTLKKIVETGLGKTLHISIQ